jgi:hypothetical protein
MFLYVLKDTLGTMTQWLDLLERMAIYFQIYSYFDHKYNKACIHDDHF